MPTMLWWPLCENWEVIFDSMVTSSNGNFFSALLLFLGESTGHWWIPLTKASDEELWYFLWSEPEQMVDQTTETPVIRDAIALKMTSPLCIRVLLGSLCEPPSLSLVSRDCNGSNCSHTHLPIYQSLATNASFLSWFKFYATCALLPCWVIKTL